MLLVWTICISVRYLQNSGRFTKNDDAFILQYSEYGSGGMLNHVEMDSGLAENDSKTQFLDMQGLFMPTTIVCKCAFLLSAGTYTSHLRVYVFNNT